MPFFNWLVGHLFCDLLLHGREIEPVIARKDASLLTHSTPELERYFDKTPAELPRQNAFPVAIAMLLFLVAFALNLLTLLRLLSPLTPAVHALLFFAPSLAMLLATVAASFLLARGFSAGLAGFGYLLSALLLATVGQLVYNLLITGGSTVPLLLAFAALLGCRRVLNGAGFVLFTLYCRTQRIAKVAREIRI